uniref:Uncharacterized protein n=2 Tax=Globodera rostochiensis TaxID=31243 RepID=A0A914GST1_GLORO
MLLRSTTRTQTGFDATPYLPQSQSTRWTGGTTNASSQFQVQQPSSLIKYHLPGSAPHYGGAMPYQQAPRTHGCRVENAAKASFKPIALKQGSFWVREKMRALLLLTLAFSCILKNSYCISYEDLINNKEAMDLVKENYDFRKNTLFAVDDLLQKLNNIKLEMCTRTLQRYVKKMREDGGGTPNFEASASGNPGSSIPNEEAGGGTSNFQASGNPGSSIPYEASVIQNFAKAFGIEPPNPYDGTLYSIYQNPPK